MIHSCTVQTHQLCGYRKPGLLPQMAFCQLCRAALVHYRACEATGEHKSQLVQCQTAANVHLNLSCGLCTTLSPTVNMGPLSVPLEGEPAFSLPIHPTTPPPFPTHPPSYIRHL